MNVLIYGFNALGIYLGSLLSLRGEKVSFMDPGNYENKISSIRLILPQKWFKIENIRYGAVIDTDFLFICPSHDTGGEGYVRGIIDELKGAIHQDTEVVVFNSYNLQTEERWKALRNGLCFSLPLLDLQMLQEDQVELFTAKPLIILEKNRRLKKFLAPLKQFGLKFKYTDSLVPFCDTYRLFSLIYLPVALSNTTMENFLSFPEGQKIIGNILSEGVKIFGQMEKKPVSLPFFDPRVLLAAIQKKPGQFLANRMLPGRNYNPVLQSLFLNKQKGTLFNQALLKMAGELGISLFWNEKVVSLMNNVKTTGLFKNPVELLKAIE